LDQKKIISPKKREEWYSTWNRCEKKLILLDLDGTILDTAGDLGGAANVLRKKRGMSAIDIAEYRGFISKGAKGMIQVALDLDSDHPKFNEVREEFLEEYSKNLLNKTKFLPNMDLFLKKLDEMNIKWGIVTNKHTNYALPIINGITLLNEGCSILVCGDTTNHPKPHPDPILFALKELNFTGEQTIYIGDDPRDIQSGYSAGCWTHALKLFENKASTGIKSWGSDETSFDIIEMARKLGLSIA
jgi:phosphoglycolate phosphatase